MRKIALAFAVALSFVAAAAAAKSQGTHTTAPTGAALTLLDGVALNAAAGTRTFSWGNNRAIGYKNFVFWVEYTHANNGTLTLTCTHSHDENVSDYAPTTCASSGGTCTLSFGGVFVTPSLSADQNYKGRMGIDGARDFSCVIAHGGSPAAGDLVTIKGYLTAE